MQKNKQKPDTQKKNSKVASIISGSLSGALVSACVQPLDVLRTRIQADSARGTLRSTAQTIQLIVKDGGMRSLWQGTQPTVIRLGLGAGLHFFFLESIKPLFETPSQGNTSAPTMTAMGAALTGGLSRIMAAMISCPVTVVKTRMELVGASDVGVPRYNNTFHALRMIAKTEGLRGLYRGLGPTLLSNAPFSALYYLFYTRLRNKLSTGDTPPSTLVNFASSSVAAIAATLITQPADVVRTRMQLNLATAAVSSAKGAGGSTKNTLELIGYIARSQGMSGLFAGAAPRMVKRSLQTALVWTMYEELMPRLSLMKSWVSEKVATS